MIRRRSAFWSRRFLRGFGPVAGLAAVGVVSLLLSGHLAVPFAPMVTLEGLTASKGDLFEDARMRALLEERHIRVHVTRSGSRAIARADLEGFDFVFPSGRPAANRIKERIGAGKTYKPFATPLVLGTFRQYAETLVAAGAATAQPGGTAAGPMYYTLDMKRFFALIKAGKTWDDLGIGTQPDVTGRTITNGNRVYAHSPNLCDANSAESYTALAAFVENQGTAPTEGQVAAVADGIREPLTIGGMPDADLLGSYIAPEGKSKAPIVVVYEHQFLTYQVRRQIADGVPDGDRVMLYPDREVLTDPEYFVLNARADRLGTLLRDDPALRQRAMELGYRVLDPTGETDSEQLWRYLREHGIPVPDRGGVLTKADLPALPALEQLVKAVGACRD
ncbi:hypothetical protein ACIA8K_13645 [Catenuloplanes sp. NPDC051500]|uniref:hypothetical protein n=1 Tax=Catenuloplanes sp. NPDC051500 TaxID=3363959 RepID=UPI0037ACF60A